MPDIIYLSTLFEKLALSKEAPITAPFGEYAWAPHREGKIDEPDNALEKEIYNQLKKHFASTNREGLPEITANFLSLLMELGYYKSVLHPPPVKTVYRGIKFKTITDLSKFLNIPEDQIEDSGEIKFNKPIEHKNGFSSSWTIKKSIAQDSLFISWNGPGKKGYFVTLYANIKDNPYKFIAGPGGLYDVDGLSKWHLEKETIGLEPIIISKIEWKKL